MNFLQSHIFFFFFILLLSHGLAFADFPLKFTPEQKAEAVQMLNNGRTVAEVARKFGASVASVRNWRHAARRQRTNGQAAPQRQQRSSHFTPAEIPKIFEMIENRENPSSFQEVAIVLSATAAEIFILVRDERERTGEASQLRRGLKFTSEEKSEAVEKVFRGQTVEEVAEEYNTHPNNVTIWTRIEEEKRRPQGQTTQGQGQTTQGQGQTTQGQTQTVAPQRRHLTQRENLEATQMLKDGIEEITTNTLSVIPDVLNDLKTTFEGYFHKGLTFSEEVREEFLTLLKEVREELSQASGGGINEEINSHIESIEKIIHLLSDPCADDLT